MTYVSLLRPDVAAERRGRSRSQQYVDVRNRLVTPPIRLSAQVSAWPDYEIDELIRAEISGATENELRALVEELVARRKNLRPVSGGAPKK